MQKSGAKCRCNRGRLYPEKGSFGGAVRISPQYQLLVCLGMDLAA